MKKIKRLRLLEGQLNNSQEFISKVVNDRFVPPTDPDLNYIYFVLHNLLEFVDGVICSLE